MLKAVARRLLPQPVYESLRRARHRAVYRGLDYRGVFAKIYAEGRWRDAESISGPGSTLAITQALREDLARWLRNNQINSLVDIPCGDFNWMRFVQFPDGMDYLGLDIVDDLISELRAKHETEHVRFGVADILTSDLPEADAYLCKDIFVHFPLTDVNTALRRIARKTKFILATTTPSLRKNIDIEFGQDRMLNLSLILGEPVHTLRFYEGGGVERRIGVWRGEL